MDENSLLFKDRYSLRSNGFTHNFGIRINRSSRIKKRRRSSCYRPKFQRYPQIEHDSVRPRLQRDYSMDNGSGSTIEDLSVGILGHICYRLGTPDLLNLCVTSRLLYLPAAMELYRKVVVCEKKSLVSTVRSCTTQKTLHVGTLIHSVNLAKFLEVLINNEKIAAFLKTLIILGEMEPIQLSILDTTLKTVDLRTFIAPRLGIPKIGTLESLRMLHICAGSIELVPLNLTHLDHLRVSYKNDSSSRIGISNLAQMLTASLTSLRTLEFSEIDEEEEDKLGLLNSLNNLNIDNFEAPWMQFFEVLNGNSRLKLESLAIDGYIGSNGKTLASLLNRVLYLSELRDLQLHIKESTHPYSTHQTTLDSTMFLENISRYTPNLKGLAISPTHDCLSCQHESLIAALENRFDLSDLHLVFESPSPNFAKQINKALVNYQAGIKNLRILDKSRLVHDQKTLLKCLSSNLTRLSYYDYGVLSQPFVDSVYHGDVFIYDLASLRTNHISIINDYTLRFINEGADHGLTEFLKYYLHLGFSPFVSSGFDLVLRLLRLQHLNVCNVDLRIVRHQIYYTTNSLEPMFGRKGV